MSDAQNYATLLREDAKLMPNYDELSAAQRAGADAIEEIERLKSDIANALQDNARLQEEVERLREALTPSEDTKRAYTAVVMVDSAPYIDEDGDEVTQSFYVPWIAIKNIMGDDRRPRRHYQSPGRRVMGAYHNALREEGSREDLLEALEKAWVEVERRRAEKAENERLRALLGELADAVDGAVTSDGFVSDGEIVGSVLPLAEKARAATNAKGDE